MSTRKAGKAKGDAHNATHGDANPAVEAGMSRDIINIPDNVIQDGIKGYSEKEQDAVQWAFTFGRTELGNSRSRMCETFGIDWTTFIRVAQGKYPASLNSIVAKIQDVQRRADRSASAGFVETTVTKKIFDVLDYALAGDIKGGHIVMITGPSRRSKTEATTHWCQLNNHGRSVYVDCPESGGLRAFFHELAVKLGVNTGRTSADLRSRLIKSFNKRRILIVDEIFRLLPSGRRVSRPVELEFIRRLHDVTGCAVALIATPVFKHEMEAGYLRAYLEQLLGRIEDPLDIPAHVRKDEVRAICHAFCDRKPADDLVDLAHKIANMPGKLGVLFALLRQAKAGAVRRNESLTYKHLAAAYQRRKNRTAWPTDEGEKEQK